MCGQFEGHLCTIDVACAAGISVYQIKDGGDIQDIVLNDESNQEYWIGSTKGLLIIRLDEEYNIIEKHESHLKDKDIKCLAKVADDTFILGIRFSPDLLVFKRSQSNTMIPLF
jgi:ligand-binding sensor domain-containing protein